MGGIGSKQKKKLILIGPMGHGKSTTGNTLCGGANCFSSGQDVVSVTQKIKMQVHENLTVIDCPGFGDATNENLFMDKFLEKKNELLGACPIDAFVLVIKFDVRESKPFLLTAKQFVKCFGSLGTKSLIILCIQGNPQRRFSDDDFDEIIKSSDGYRYLKEKNDNRPIPYCLWENIHSEYLNQRANFELCQKQVSPYTDVHMKFAFDLIGSQRE